MAATTIQSALTCSPRTSATIARAKAPRTETAVQTSQLSRRLRLSAFASNMVRFLPCVSGFTPEQLSRLRLTRPRTLWPYFRGGSAAVELESQFSNIGLQE